jgi:hypothetical protein
VTLLEKPRPPLDGANLGHRRGRGRKNEGKWLSPYAPSYDPDLVMPAPPVTLPKINPARHMAAFKEAMDKVETEIWLAAFFAPNGPHGGARNYRIAFLAFVAMAGASLAPPKVSPPAPALAPAAPILTPTPRRPETMIESRGKALEAPARASRERPRRSASLTRPIPSPGARCW